MDADKQFVEAVADFRKSDEEKEIESLHDQLRKAEERYDKDISNLAEQNKELRLANRKAEERERILREALRPFARFACSDKGECDCHNCRARDLLEEQAIEQADKA